MRAPGLLLAVFLAPRIFAMDPMCGTSVENDEAVRAFHRRQHDRSRIVSNASPAATARDGAIYLQSDDRIAPGYRPFDLEGQSLVFEPRSASTFRVRREALSYTEPIGAAVRNFDAKSGTPWYSVAHDLPFTLTLFGRTVNRVHVTAFNAILLDEPDGEEGAMQVDAAEAAVQPKAIVSPLLITNRKPRTLAYPEVFIEDTPAAVIVTWRSTAGTAFGYDVQAELRRDGTIVFSYKDVRAMSWGAPIVSAGWESSEAPRESLGAVADNAGDVNSSASATIKAMADIRRAEVFRIDGSDLFAVRLELAAPVDVTLLAEGQSLRYVAQLDTASSSIELDRTGTATIRPFSAMRAGVGGSSVQVRGNVVEFFGVEAPADAPKTRSLRTWSYIRPLSRSVDASSLLAVSFAPPARKTGADFSALASPSDLAMPILEAFVLPPFDPFEVYDRLQEQFSLNDYRVDAVAMYQTFFTDIIFYAGAYATGGNAGVNGIAPINSELSRFYARAPSLLHMNQLTYNYSAAPETASKVMLHEFGHRWMYYVSIDVDGNESRVLNPVSAHPAGYVHTASAFPVYGSEESSVMGGGYFAEQPDGSYRARAANMGYSWTDLYLMGLANPEEVRPWFYLDETNPPLANEYWPEDGAIVSGTRRSVSIDQILAVHGPRNPTTATAQRHFNVVFVLVTEPGVDPTDEQVAKINEWRALMSRNFSIATGGRGMVSTKFVIPTKKRATR